jgi:phosphoribosylformimino-5-aminoimidazole carboxamide ribotide isomerase
VAVRQPEVVAQALMRFGPERIAVGLDARGGRIAVAGWQEEAEVTVLDLARRVRALGVSRVIYTDIARDGMLTGLDAEAAARLAEEAGVTVIASGGVASLEDIRRLKAVEQRGVEGVIIGQALYTGTLSLAAVLAIAQGKG